MMYLFMSVLIFKIPILHNCFHKTFKDNLHLSGANYSLELWSLFSSCLVLIMVLFCFVIFLSFQLCIVFMLQVNPTDGMVFAIPFIHV